MYGLYSRAASNQERPMMTRVRYSVFITWSAMWIIEVIQYPASRMSIKLLLELFEFEKGQKGSKQTMVSTYFST